MPEGFSFTIEKYILKLMKPMPLGSLAAIILLSAILFFISRKTRYNTKILAYGAVAIATSFVLSYIVVMKFPNGGSITVASMLPLFIFSYMAGPRAGMLAGLCYGLLQYIQQPYFVHWAQFLLDFPIGFAALGLAGIFRKNVYLGALTGSMARFVCHFISGIVFFASYAEGKNVFLYSFGYNMSYILPDALICLGILAVPSVRAAIERIRNENGWVSHQKISS